MIAYITKLKLSIILLTVFLFFQFSLDIYRLIMKGEINDEDRADFIHLFDQFDARLLVFIHDREGIVIFWEKVYKILMETRMIWTMLYYLAGFCSVMIRNTLIFHIFGYFALCQIFGTGVYCWFYR